MTAAAFTLEGRRALVTGAAGGIGLAIARLFSELGAKVAMADRDGDRLASAVTAVGPLAQAVPGDISSEDGVERLCGEVLAVFGPLDILVNNAGVTEPIKRTVDQDVADWQHVMDVNLRGTFLMSRAVARHMLARRSPGAIVNIASIVGLVGIPSSNAYGVSKTAIIQLTRNMACEWASRGLRVNCVAPGYIEAPMAMKIFAEGQVTQADIEKRVPSRRLGQDKEVAYAVAFLASDAASYVNGITLPVDGGWYAYGGP